MQKRFACMKKGPKPFPLLRCAARSDERCTLGAEAPRLVKVGGGELAAFGSCLCGAVERGGADFTPHLVKLLLREVSDLFTVGALITSTEAGDLGVQRFDRGLGVGQLVAHGGEAILTVDHHVNQLALGDLVQLEEKKSPRLLLMMPYRHGKSEIASRHFAPWVFGQHPNWEIIAASNAQSLATSFSRYVRDVLRDPGYASVFPETRLDPSSQAAESWSTTKGGGYLAAGIGTAIIGRGAHILLIDDPVRDAEAADSQVIRDNTWEWYITTAKSRLSPGGGVLGIMTCWNDDDWGGRVQLAASAGGDQFEIVRYPAINDQGDEYILADDTIVQIPPNTPVPAGSRLTRRINSPLHPARYTLDMLKAIKASYYALGNQRWWAAGYQQNPTPDEGLVFTKEMFRYYGTAPARSEMYVYQAWDFAISEGKEADYTVGVCIGVDHRDNVYILDLRRFKSQDAFIIVDTMLDFASQYDATLGVEDGQIWKAIEAQFKKRCEERRQYPSYEVLKPLTDKLVRANPLRGRMQLGKVYFDKDATWFGEMFRELLHFPAGKHDDQIDALAWAVRLTLGRAAPRQQVPRIKLKSWKDELPGLVGRRGGSFMAA